MKFVVENKYKWTWARISRCLALVCFFCLAVTTLGCATAHLTAAGQQVEMIQHMKRADCKNLGPVFGKGGGVFGGVWIPDEELMEYASNDMRNKAAAKGATHLVFSSHQMGHSGGRYGGTTSTSTISGVAYKCPTYGQPPIGASEEIKPKVIEQGPEGWGSD